MGDLPQLPKLLNKLGRAGRAICISLLPTSEKDDTIPRDNGAGTITTLHYSATEFNLNNGRSNPVGENWRWFTNMTDTPIVANFLR